MSVETTLLVLLVLVAILLIVRFEAFCLQDLSRTPDPQLLHFSRQGWIALIVLFIPVGGVLYLKSGKATR